MTIDNIDKEHLLQEDRENSSSTLQEVQMGQSPPSSFGVLSHERFSPVPAYAQPPQGPHNNGLFQPAPMGKAADPGYMGNAQPGNHYMQPAYSLQTMPTAANPQYINNNNVVTAEDDAGFNCALAVLLIGFCIAIVWLGGIAYINSSNKSVRTMGRASLILLVVWIVLVAIVTVASK
eukprot:gene3836-4427_t